MENVLFLKQLQNSYDSLKYFSITNNRLILHLDKDYIIPLIHTKLINLNPNLFLLTPQDIFHIIYMLELLYKTNLNDSEIKFIENYTNKYLKMNDLAIENNQIDKNMVWCFSIPIYSSYDPIYIENPCSKIIQKLLNNHTEEIENSKGLHPKLILSNTNFQIAEDDNLANFEKAGFTTLFLITGAVVATCIYIIYFIAK